MVNQTKDSSQTTTQEPLCLHGLYGIHQKILFSVLNVSLSITAFLGNMLVIVALHRVPSLHPPSKLLLSCLVSSDLCVGLISLPVYVTYILTPEYSRRCLYLRYMTLITNVFFGGVSLFTLTAISVDRLLALLLRLRYSQEVTLRRAWISVVIGWTLCAAISLMFLYNFRVTIFIVVTLMFLYITISTFCYLKIYCTLRHHQAQVQEHVYQGQLNGGGIPLNIARYKKTVSTARWVQMTLLACYLPFGVFVAVRGYTGISRPSLDPLLWAATSSFVYLNSSLNPLLYCWRIIEVRQAVKDTIKHFCC